MSDWYEWITTKRIPENPLLPASRQPPTAAPGFYERYEDDLERAASELHGDATRLSIEWSRVFPEPTFGVTGFDALHGSPPGRLLAGLEPVVGRGSLLSYLSSVAQRLIQIDRVLKPTGSLFLHCDPPASHSLKILLDTLFTNPGACFRNDTIWSYSPCGRRRTV